MSIAALIAEQAQRVRLDPTDPQKRVGNYRKGHVRVHGLPITIENPKGSVRTGVGADGETWRSQLPAHYGYIKRTEGADGDHVDCYIGPHHKSPLVYVVDQRDPDSQGFDEHKVLLGFASPKQARATYEAAFSDGSGKRRMGHLTEITVSQFKDWLRDGDTTTPYKRQHGGRIPYRAEGGPVFDPDQQVEVPQFDTNQQIEGMQPDLGKMHAVGRGAAQGFTAGFSDELQGLKAAGAPDVEPTNVQRSSSGREQRATPASLSRVVRGAYRYATGAPGAEKAYDEAVGAERKIDEAAQKHHPWIYGGGEVAGAIPSMMVLPEAQFARLPLWARGAAKTAQVGAEYGALHGAGTGKNAGDRAAGAATEGGLGAALGPVAVGVGNLAKAGLKKVIQPLASVYRGLRDPDGEAARRLMTTIYADQELIRNGAAKGMPIRDWVAAKANGEPVTLADLGSGNTQALLRSSGNTSPEARARIEKIVEDRFLSQGERVAADVRNLVPGGANAGRTADQLVAEYDAARVPAYKKSFEEGDKPIITPVIEGMLSSQMFQGAMKGALSTGKDRAVKEGYRWMNPGVELSDNGVKFTRRSPDGKFMPPNLQYWDAVKRELDAVASKAQRSGDGNVADIAGGFAKMLRGELDKAVPSYKDTRGIAAEFFGERDALEAGRKLAGKRIDPDELSKIVRKMSPQERVLFQEGYASDLAGRVIGEMKNTADITKAMFNNGNEVKRIRAIFGDAGVQKLEARIALETFMDGARRAMGNSTTAAQLAAMGMAGGMVEGGYSHGLDPTAILTHGLMGAGAGAMASHRIPQLAASGARRLIGRVDRNTATSVAKLLMSDDPSAIAEGLRLAAKNQQLLENLKSMATRVSLAGQTEVSGAAPRLLAAPVRAEDQQPQP